MAKGQNIYRFPCICRLFGLSLIEEIVITEYRREVVSCPHIHDEGPPPRLHPPDHRVRQAHHRRLRESLNGKWKLQNNKLKKENILTP